VAIRLRKRGSGAGPNIPTASTGDIAFLILIFFMSTSMFAKEKGLKIVLPELSEAPTPIPPQNVLQVNVSPKGDVMVGTSLEQPVVVAIPQLREEVARRLAANKDLAISFRVSRRAPYRVMIDVFDQLKLAKADRVSLLHVPQLEEGSGP
jgi:biopolymer transport protein ExbD